MTSRTFGPYRKDPVKTWQELIEVEDDLSKGQTKAGEKPDEWIFRGQNTDEFPANSLERHVIENLVGVRKAGVVDLDTGTRRGNVDASLVL